MLAKGKCPYIHSRNSLLVACLPNFKRAQAHTENDPTHLQANGFLHRALQNRSGILPLEENPTSALWIPSCASLWFYYFLYSCIFFYFYRTTEKNKFSTIALLPPKCSSAKQLEKMPMPAVSTPSTPTRSSMHCNLLLSPQRH